MNAMTIESPVGLLTITADEEGITSILMDPEPVADEPSALVREAADQMQAYFEGRLRRFDLPLAASGTDFQRTVWSALTEIGFGQTASYGQIAARIGSPGASRAVGLANGRNPIAIVVPCHRVIGASGALTGYAAGIERKRILLEHERAVLHR